ncbi:MAG: hypothetical protein GY832_30910 [Chloroflexi bacterium]|nr:hypothetical protein [Chloroflexota bacterium]
MGVRGADVLAQICEPIEKGYLKTKPGKGHITFFNASAVTDRFNRIFGIDWKEEYEVIERLVTIAGSQEQQIQSVVICKLSAKIGDEWVTREGRSGYGYVAAYGTSNNGIKAGYSGAKKRAAMNWGMGAELKNDPDTRDESMPEVENQIPADTAAWIRDEIDDLGIDEKVFLNYVGAESVESIVPSQLHKVKHGIELKRRKLAEAAREPTMTEVDDD